MNYLPPIPDDWRQALGPYYDFARLEALDGFLADEAAGHEVFPPASLTFAALQATPFADVKALILGQDPYHDDGQACGLAFSVVRGTPPPPSLRNILKEYSDDLGLPPPVPDLRPWATHGVLLLNTVLTVRAHAAASHQAHGWEDFTDAVIRALNDREQPVAFILWGNPAKRKLPLITRRHHAVLTGVHPSPLSAYRGFFGSRPFSSANMMLLQRGADPVDWRLPAE